MSVNNYDYGKWASEVISAIGYKSICCFGSLYGAGIKNTLFDYKNFPSFRNVYEVNLALQPAKRIHFLLEGLKPNLYLKKRFFYGDSSDLKVVGNRDWGVLEIGDTELEFLTISINNKLIDKTRFYLQGRKITYEEVLLYLDLDVFGSGKK